MDKCEGQENSPCVTSGHLSERQCQALMEGLAFLINQMNQLNKGEANRHDCDKG